MSMKQEIETWVAALSHYDSSNYEAAIAAFRPIADTSKILFNCGVIRASIGDHVAAVQYYQRALGLDQYLAVAYFQQGVSNFLLGEFEEALANFNDALLYLRGNKCIDYEQLGLKFKLHSCEALFNRGLCYIYLQQADTGMRDLTFAAKEKSTINHDVIDEAIKDKADGYTVFSIPVGVVFRPSEAKVRNVGLRDYMGKARLVAAAESPDSTSQKRNFALQQWGHDDRSPDSISFAATHLVRSTTANRARQQSEPPMHRTLFPPTPPPEAEKPTFARPRRQPSPDRVPDGGPDFSRSLSLRSRPTRLELGTASLDSSNLAKQLPVLHVETTRLPTPAFPPESEPEWTRPRLMRSSSERPANRKPEMISSNPETLRSLEPGLSFSPVERITNKWNSNTLSPDTARGSLRTHASRQLKLQRPASIEEEDENNNGPYTAGTTDVTPTSANPSSEIDAAARLSWHIDRRLSMASSTREPTASGTIRLKAHYKKEIRYLSIHHLISLEDLLIHIGKKFGVKGVFRIQTKDEDGDMITMGDQEDLDTAIAMAMDACGRGVVKFEVWVLET